jgi:hypothetical protein
VEDEQQQPSSSADEEEGGIADAAELQALLAKTQEEVRPWCQCAHALQPRHW